MKLSAPLVLFVLFLTTTPLHAQPLRVWTNFTDVNDVNAITSYGDTIWLATNGGVIRFLESDPSNQVRLTNAEGLGDNQVRFVTVDSNGVLWCGGENGMLSRRRHDKSWSVYPFEDENGQAIRLNAAAPGPDGFLWVASDKGVHKFDTQRNGGEIKESYTRIGAWPDEASVSDVLVNDTTLWIVGDAGVAIANVADPFLLDRSHWTVNLTAEPLIFIISRWPSSMLFSGSATALYGIVYEFDSLFATRGGADSSYGGLVAGTVCSYETIWLLGASGRWLTFSPAQGGAVLGAIPAGFTSVHCTDQAVYFGQTNGGVWRLINDTWTHIELSGPLDNNITDIAIDNEGRVWTAHTVSGASYLDENGNWHSLPYVIAGPSAPMTSVDIAPNGQIWYGTFGSGIWEINPNDPLNPATATNYRKENSSLMWVQNPQNPGAFNYFVVQDVVVDKQGRVWAANALSDSGAVIAWNDNDCWGRFDANDGITSNTPIVIYPLDSSILVGFGNIGIMEMNFRQPLCSNGQPVSQTPRLGQRTTADGLPSDLVTALTYDNSDSLWVGTSLGLARYARDRRRFFKINMPPEAGLTVNTIAVDANNSLWIGTSLGLVVRDADGTMTFYNSRNSGLVGDFVTEIQIDERNGDVWISTQSGLSKTNGPLTTSSDIESIVAYPNPFVIGETDRVRFNAPSGSTITIATVSGHQVNSISSDTGWDGRNDSGELVVTGVYLFAVRSPNGDYGTGKIAVIRR